MEGNSPNQRSQESAEKMRLAVEKLEQEVFKPDPLPERTLPWFIDIFLYPIQHFGNNSSCNFYSDAAVDSAYRSAFPRCLQGRYVHDFLFAARRLCLLLHRLLRLRQLKRRPACAGCHPL